jgi:hypothetical protein
MDSRRGPPVVCNSRSVGLLPKGSAAGGGLGGAGVTQIFAPPYNHDFMLARVIFVLFAFLLLGSGSTNPAQSFSGTAAHVEQPAGASGPCIPQACLCGAVDGNALGQPAQAGAESGSEQLEMHCLLEASEPAPMTPARLAPLMVRAPVAPFLDGLDRPPKASARAS